MTEMTKGLALQWWAVRLALQDIVDVACMVVLVDLRVRGFCTSACGFIGVVQVDCPQMTFLCPC
jgi:hypothetical protein